MCVVYICMMKKGNEWIYKCVSIDLVWGCYFVDCVWIFGINLESFYNF